MLGNLVVSPQSAHLTRNTEIFTRMDPYVRVIIGNQIQDSIPAKNFHKQPYWRGDLAFTCPKDQVINFEIWDKCSGKDRLIGTTTMSLASLTENYFFDWLPLTYKGKPAGQFLVWVHFYPTDTSRGQSDSIISSQPMGMQTEPRIQAQTIGTQPSMISQPQMMNSGMGSMPINTGMSSMPTGMGSTSGGPMAVNSTLGSTNMINYSSNMSPDKILTMNTDKGPERMRHLGSDSRTNELRQDTHSSLNPLSRDTHHGLSTGMENRSIPMQSGMSSMPMQSGMSSVPMQSGMGSMPMQSGMSTMPMQSGMGTMSNQQGMMYSGMDPMTMNRGMGSGMENRTMSSGMGSMPLQSSMGSLSNQQGMGRSYIDSSSRGMDSGMSSIPLQSGMQQQMRPSYIDSSRGMDSGMSSMPIQSGTSSMPGQYGLGSTNMIPINSDYGMNSRNQSLPIQQGSMSQMNPSMMSYRGMESSMGMRPMSQDVNTGIHGMSSGMDSRLIPMQSRSMPIRSGMSSMSGQQGMMNSGMNQMSMNRGFSSGMENPSMPMQSGMSTMSSQQGLSQSYIDSSSRGMERSSYPISGMQSGMSSMPMQSGMRSMPMNFTTMTPSGGRAMETTFTGSTMSSNTGMRMMNTDSMSMFPTSKGNQMSSNMGNYGGYGGYDGLEGVISNLDSNRYYEGKSKMHVSGQDTMNASGQMLGGYTMGGPMMTGPMMSSELRPDSMTASSMQYQRRPYSY